MCPIPPLEKVARPPAVDLLFLRELLAPNVVTPELNVQHALHSAENLLIGRGGTPLEVLHDCDGGVALSGEFLLGHLVALFCSTLLDSVCDCQTNGLGLDDVVAAVDLCEVLAFDGACAAGLCGVSKANPRRLLEELWKSEG